MSSEPRLPSEPLAWRETLLVLIRLSLLQTKNASTDVFLELASPASFPAHRLSAYLRPPPGVSHLAAYFHSCARSIQPLWPLPSSSLPRFGSTLGHP